MKQKKIIYEIRNHAAYITLNNPEKLNCMGFQMLSELEDALIKAEKNKEVHLLIVKGAGEKAFSTGADLNEFKSLSEEKAVEWIEYGNKVFNTLEAMGKPTLAYIDGYAIGGGLELALACDFRIGSGKAVFSSPELRHGWLPGWGGMVRLRRLIGEAKTKEVILLCEKIKADNALAMGLLTMTVDNEEDPKFVETVDHLKKLKPTAFKLAKAVIMDETRSTRGADLQFDILAMQIVKN